MWLISRQKRPIERDHFRIVAALRKAGLPEE